LVGAIVVGQMLGWPLLVALLWLRTDLIAFALAASLGVHFLPYGWLYRAPAYYLLGIASVAVATVLQALAPMTANVTIALSMAVLYVAAGIAVLRQNRRDAADAEIASPC
jgi:cytidylate kinase